MTWLVMNKVDTATAKVEVLTNRSPYVCYSVKFAMMLMENEREDEHINKRRYKYKSI